MTIVDNPEINFIDETDRKDGISAFMRIRNGGDYLRISILSVIDQVDEVICVFNNSTDLTENILINLKEEYPDKIKVYKYVPIVYPPNSKGYLNTPSDSPNSLVYYYNYTLSLTTYKYLFKFDDDEIFFPGIFEEYKNILKKDNNKCIAMRGINLYDYNYKLYLNKSNLKTVGYDTIFFIYNNSCIFKKDERYEVFSHNIGTILGPRDSFYHLKRCKVDRGINNYDLDINKNSRYFKMNLELYKNMELYNFFDSDIYKEIDINPYDLGFDFRGNKEFDVEIFNELEKKIKIND